MDRSTFMKEFHAKIGLPRPVVINLAEKATGGSVVDVERLVEGAEYEVHRARLVDGRTVFARFTLPDEPIDKLQSEATAMVLARAAGVPVPEVFGVGPIVVGDVERQSMVVEEAHGRQLSGLLESLSLADRNAIMVDIGRVLSMLHSVEFPGTGSSDSGYRRYIAGVIADCDHLDVAGFSESEVEQIRALVGTFAEIPEQELQVLCHGDLSSAHFFVDNENRVSGLIDWGMWSARAPLDDLADFAQRHDLADLAAVLDGYYGSSASDPELRRAISRALMTRVIGNLRWLITSGQTLSLEPGARTLRRAFGELTLPKD
jgi:aminoglycoside phosphotransferase (APT) family kinase protein